MKVPTYDSPQVQERGLPSVRQDTVASAKLFAGVGDAAIQTGAGLMKGGGEAAKLAANMADRENADSLFRVETAFTDEFIQFETQQRSKKGAAALADGGITEQTEKWFSETARKHAGTLGNDVQRRLFNQKAEQMRQGAVRSLSQHQAVEARHSLEESTNASIVGAINLAVGSANDWTILEREANNIRARVQVLAGINGKSPEWVAATTGDRLTMLHKQMLEQLVVSNPSAAKVYFDKYQGEIDGSQRAEIGQFAARAAATSIGDGAADAIWKAGGPKNRTDPVRLADMEEKLRGALKGNDDAIEKGIKGLRERATVYKDQRKEESIALEASVNGLILQGVSAAQLRKRPEYLRLSDQAPEEARKIDTFMENREYTRVARAAASEQRADAAEARQERRLHRDTLDTALRVSDPAVLASMSRNDVVNLLPVLGSTTTTALVGRWDLFSKSSDKLREATIDKQDFDRIALETGLRPNRKGMDEQEKDRLLRLQAQVESVIDLEQRAKKRALTREEKVVIMQREIDNTVMVRRILIMPNASKPLAVLTADEMDRAYVEVGPNEQRVKLSEISPRFRADAIRARRAQGLPTSEKIIAELWLRSRGEFVEAR